MNETHTTALRCDETDARTRHERGRWRKRLTVLGLLVAGISPVGCTMNNERRIDWSVSDMPPQKGKIFLVTGGSSGIGYESARALAASGAQVVIASRSSARADEAIANIRRETPNAQVRFEPLDLADLASVRALGKRLNKTLPHLDGLINNAGIMEPPQRGTSADGFEMQFATNYAGHFVLTAETLGLLSKADAPRVVTLSSIAAVGGSINFADLQFEAAYDPGKAYQQSKLACLMFALELQRRSDSAGWGIRSIASHPGVSRTDLIVRHRDIKGSIRRNLPFLFQPADQGDVSTLYAATAPEARGGSYYGPVGLAEIRGPLGHAKVPTAASDPAAAARLWSVTEHLTGSRYP